MAEEELEKDVQAVHRVPKDKKIIKKIQAEGSNLVERMQMPWPKETTVDLMKSSGMAGRTVMTTKDKRRYLHSCKRARTEAALLTWK